MKRWNRRQRNIIFVLAVLLAFLAMPLYMDYLPAAERLGIYFLEKEGIRGPFLWFPLLLHRWGLGIQTCCKAYIFLVNLAGLLASFYCFAQVAENCYAGLAGSFCYCFSVYYVYIYMVRGSLGEMTASVFLPIYGLGLWRLYTWEQERKGYWKSGILLAAGLTGIWLSCVPVAFVFSGFTVLIGLVLAPRTFRRKTFAVLAAACAVTAAVTVGITVPYAKKVLSGGLYADGAAGSSFAARALLPSRLLLPFQGSAVYDAEVFQDHAGYVGLGLPFLVLIIVWAADGFLRERKRGDSLWRRICFMAGLCGFSALLCTAAFPWEWFAGLHWSIRALLEHIGYPWRFLAPAVLSGSMAVGLYGSRIWSRGEKAMGVFLAGVTVCNVLSGIYLMDSLLYTTVPNRSYEVQERYQDAEYVFYISE